MVTAWWTPNLSSVCLSPLLLLCNTREQWQLFPGLLYELMRLWTFNFQRCAPECQLLISFVLILAFFQLLYDVEIILGIKTVAVRPHSPDITGNFTVLEVRRFLKWVLYYFGNTEEDGGRLNGSGLCLLTPAKPELLLPDCITPQILNFISRSGTFPCHVFD